jgi:hypothetical protein
LARAAFDAQPVSSGPVLDGGPPDGGVLGKFRVAKTLVANNCSMVDVAFCPDSSDDLLLSSDGLLSSPGSGAETPPCSPHASLVDPSYSPRLVMEMFPVSLSPVSKMGSLGVVDSQ